jgi:hypothetical protein
MKARSIANLERALADVDHIEDLNARLLEDVNRAEAIEEAVRVAQGRASLEKVQLTGIDVSGYLSELAASEDADIQAVAAMLRETYNFEPPTEGTTDEILERVDSLLAKRDMAQLGFLEAQEFMQTLDQEINRCWRSGESLAVFKVHVSGDRTPADDARIAKSLRDFAFIASDRIGAYEDGFGIIMPWMNQAEASSVLETLGHIVAHDTPDRSISVGTMSIIPTAATAPTIARAAGRSR